MAGAIFEADEADGAGVAARRSMEASEAVDSTDSGLVCQRSATIAAARISAPRTIAPALVSRPAAAGAPFDRLTIRAPSGHLSSSITFSGGTVSYRDRTGSTELAEVLRAAYSSFIRFMVLKVLAMLCAPME
jgi:hypothetical protein